jgi:hypothetical protein
MILLQRQKADCSNLVKGNGKTETILSRMEKRWREIDSMCLVDKVTLLSVNELKQKCEKLKERYSSE